MTNDPIYIGGTYQKRTRQGVQKMPSRVDNIKEWKGQPVVILFALKDGRESICPLHEFNDRWEIVKS